ncbi:hypothetical protein [Nocardioides sp. BYT-33-1]|uniref:hypothetical protein n=1 Tax=Nocardioides sp. BYT-33-1 TaxID=3416952 RepID=UPI003F5360CB
MTGLHTALRALADEWTAVYERWNGVSDGPRVAIFNVHARKILALLAEHEPTPSDQALRDLRAEVEALVDRMLCPWDKAAVERLLASSAPATASEDCRCGFGGFHDPLNRRCPAFDPNHPDVAATASEGATEPGICLWANQICEQPNHHGCLTCTTTADRDAAAGVTSSDAATDQPSGLQVPTDAATPVTSSDGDRGLSEEEIGTLLCRCGVHICPVHDENADGYVEHRVEDLIDGINCILAARTAGGA